MLNRLLIVFVGALALPCCVTPEKYYRLSAEGPVPGNASGPALGVGPVTLPDYVDRGELVFESAPNSFEIPYEHRWAGNLRDSMTSVLGANLSRRLGTGNLHLYPWETGTPLRWQVRVEVTKFHALSGGDAVLEAGWRIDDEASGKRLNRRGTFTEAVSGDGYAAVVAAESRLLGQLAEAIAGDIPGR